MLLWKGPILNVIFENNTPGSDVVLWQSCHGQGKNIWKMKFFPGQGKVREFMDDLGNLERTWKVREKSGNLKINGYGRQISENLFILFKRGKDVLSHDIV